MAQNFLACDREQELLLPPSLREWLPEGHLAWFVIDAVAEMDLTAFYAAYREDGHGRAAHDPAMMVALLLYAYAVGRRSSRVIERACVDEVAKEILAEADAVDRAEDERFGDRRGDELPPELSTAQGRRGWLRDAKRRLDERRAAEARPVPKPRPARLREAKRRLEEEHEVHCRANEAYEAYRARGVMKDGRRFGKPPTPYTPPATPEGKVNISDPDSRNVKTPRGYMQGYNAQAVCNENQIVVAAEINADSPDFGHLEPMVSAAERELAGAGIAEAPAVVVADAGYWHHDQMDAVASRGIQILIPPDAGKRRGARPGWDGGRYAFMRRVLETDLGKQLYRKRQVTSSPCSRTPSSTAGSTASYAAADPPAGRNGG